MDEVTPPKKSLKIPVVLGFVLAVTLWAAGFVFTSGLLSKPSAAPVAVHPTVEFVALDPLLISLTDDTNRTLRFSAQLEVASEHYAEVSHLKPRVVDVMNSFLRAVPAEDFGHPEALIELRSHLMRRIDLVVGPERVSNLLITEFIIN